MFSILAVVFSVIICLVGYRMRGGWLGQDIGWGDGLNRWVSWGGGTALATLGFLPVWWVPVAMIPAMYVGATCPNFSALGMGTAPGTTYWGCFFRIIIKGLAVTVPGALVLYFAHLFWPPMVLVGLMFPIFYTIALKFFPAYDLIPVGEVGIGASIGAAIAAAFLIPATVLPAVLSTPSMITSLF